MTDVEPVGDVSGPDVDDKTEMRIIKEVEFAASCLVHGTEKITSQPRVLNLGYGRAVVDLGRTTCIPCGHSLYVTIGLFETNWEKISVPQLQVLLREALLGGSISMSDIPSDDDEEEEDLEPERPTPPANQSSGTPTPGAPASPSLGDRPRFRGSLGEGSRGDQG